MQNKKLDPLFDKEFCEKIYQIYSRYGWFVCLPSFAANKFCEYLDEKGETYNLNIREEDGLIEVTEIERRKEFELERKKHSL
jgi:hypothetical protein